MGEPVEKDGLKRCCKCHRYLPFTEYNKNAANKSGYMSVCRTCHKKYYYKKVKEAPKQKPPKVVSKTIVLGHNYRAVLYDRDGNTLARKYFKYPPNIHEISYLTRLAGIYSPSRDWKTDKGCSIKDKRYRIVSMFTEFYYVDVERLTNKEPTFKEIMR